MLYHAHIESMTMRITISDLKSVVVAGVDLRLNCELGGFEPDPFTHSATRQNFMSIDLLIHHGTNHLAPSKLCQHSVKNDFSYPGVDLCLFANPDFWVRK